MLEGFAAAVFPAPAVALLFTQGFLQVFPRLFIIMLQPQGCFVSFNTFGKGLSFVYTTPLL
jgi:hypothetical protein